MGKSRPVPCLIRSVHLNECGVTDAGCGIGENAKHLDNLDARDHRSSEYCIDPPPFHRPRLLSSVEAPLQAQPRKWKIVVTGGHPGDPEYGCGGAIARYTDLGHEVTVL